MEEITYFFSYARRDSEFVLKLAKELREVGAILWLDQLDILGGQRWDRAIEEALGACQGMIVVLSPESLASNNVMDEVSYALEAGKLVVPILLRSGTIPFRLRRVQHVDFTAGYDTGFAQLLRSLHIAQRPVRTQPPASNQHVVVPPARRPPVHNFEVPPVRTAPPAAARLSKEQAPQRDAPAFLAATVRLTNPTRRILSAIVLAVLGAIWGGAVLMAAEPRSWPIGAGIVGLAGALTGLISGKRLGIIVPAIVGMIFGFGFWAAVEWGNRDGIVRAAIFGISIGAIVGAILGVIIKKLRNLTR